MMEQEVKLESGTELAAVEHVMPSVGAQLREGREHMDMSVEDVAGKIKLSSRQIVALEEDDFKSLPETAFLRGFVRSYAKLLQLDAQPLLDALPGAAVVDQVKVEQRPVEAPFPTERSARRQNLNLLIAALLIALLIGGFSVWQSYAPVAKTVVPEETLVALPLPAQPEVATESAVPVALTPEAASSAVAALPTAPATVLPLAAPPVTASAVAASQTATLQLTFDKESWSEVRDATGKTLIRQINQPGSDLRLEGVAPFSLVIGHAAAVHLYYRDKPVDLTSYINASSDVARLTLE